jgi:hypothetical protein
VVGGAVRFDALFEKKNVGSLIAKAKIPLTDYQTEFNTQKNAGRKLAYIDGYELGGKAFVSAIWYGNLSANYSALHGQTKAQLTTAETQNIAAGTLMCGVTEYTDGGTLRYAGFWR